MKNKKGLEVGINMIIIIAIALIALIIIVGFYFGGFGSIGKGAIRVGEEVTEEGSDLGIGEEKESIQEWWESGLNFVFRLN